jgi:hypothetical protein
MRQPVAWCGLTLASVLMAWQPATGAPIPDDIIDPSSGIRIYRGITNSGSPVIVLTNLDEDGNRLPSSGGDAAVAERETPPRGAEDPARGTPGPAEAERPSPAPAATPSGSVRVVVNQDEGASQVDARDVAVTTDVSGATTVIININPPPVAATPSFTYPIVAVGGVTGGFRYPDHLNFLGYGLDISSPSWFGGLGLNAGNNFGLKTGKSCSSGYDCMFGPSSAHP